MRSEHGLWQFISDVQPRNVSLIHPSLIAACGGHSLTRRTDHEEKQGARQDTNRSEIDTTQGIREVNAKCVLRVILSKAQPKCITAERTSVADQKGSG